MNVHTFKIDSYRECPIYYRNLAQHFEYLTIINGQLYTAHMEVKPHRITKWLYRLAIEPTQYSVQQRTAVLKHLRKMAETTIDFILDGDKAKE